MTSQNLRFHWRISMASMGLILMIAGCRSAQCTPDAETAMAPPIVYEKLNAVIRPHVGTISAGTMSVATQLNDSQGCEDLLCRDLSAALINTGRFNIAPGAAAPMFPAQGMIDGVMPPGVAPSAPDVIVNVEVHEFYPYQPMRLRATFHLINPATGLVQSSIAGAWESGGDLQPMEPSRAGNQKLRRPVIPAVEEARALTRTSPRTFLNAVAHEVAASVVQSVYPVSMDITSGAESVPGASGLLH